MTSNDEKQHVIDLATVDSESRRKFLRQGPDRRCFGNAGLWRSGSRLAWPGQGLETDEPEASVCLYD